MLVEVLVSVLLFSVGVLALVGLQASMNQAQGAAKMRTDAFYLANELTGLMWSDVTHLDQYKEDSCESHARCKSWLDKLAQTLPNSRAVVTVAGGAVTIQIVWTLPDGEQHQYQSQTNIQG